MAETDAKKNSTYLELVEEAILTEKSRNGTSKQAIMKLICDKHSMEADKINKYVTAALKKGLETNRLKMAKESGKGANSYKIGDKGKNEKPTKSETKEAKTGKEKENAGPKEEKGAKKASDAKKPIAVKSGKAADVKDVKASAARKKVLKETGNQKAGTGAVAKKQSTKTAKPKGGSTKRKVAETKASPKELSAESSEDNEMEEDEEENEDAPATNEEEEEEEADLDTQEEDQPQPKAKKGKAGGKSDKENATDTEEEEEEEEAAPEKEEPKAKQAAKAARKPAAKGKGAKGAAKKK